MAYRTSKRELRRARKTVKTYEAMTALGKLPGHDGGNDTAAQRDTGAQVQPPPAPQPQAQQQQQQVVTSAVVSGGG